MWDDGLKEFKFGTVNSPVWVVAKKRVVRHVKTAALRGEVRESCSRIMMMLSMVYGSWGGHLENVGAMVFATLRSALASALTNSQRRPWTMCQL